MKNILILSLLTFSGTVFSGESDVLRKSLNGCETCIALQDLSVKMVRFVQTAQLIPQNINGSGLVMLQKLSLISVKLSMDVEAVFRAAKHLNETLETGSADRGSREGNLLRKINNELQKLTQNEKVINSLKEQAKRAAEEYNRMLKEVPDES